MFEQGTVFIVGAGGSYELDLPLGETLMDQISGLLETELNRFRDPVVQKIMISIAQGRVKDNWGDSLTRLSISAKRLVDALPFAMSIDNLLDAHRHDEDIVLIGKIGISRAILEAERNSNLRYFISPSAPGGLPDRITNASSRFKNSWYPALMRLLNAGLPLADLGRMFENVSFITFNYDRCLEHFLINGIIRYYGVDLATAVETMRNLRIVHIYGAVGSLPWMGRPNPTHFGDVETPNLLAIAQEIQTFTESANSGLVQQAHDMIKGARTLVFMGFGFLPQNVNLLGVEGTAVSRVFMTTCGISDSDVPIVESEMSDLLGKKLEQNPFIMDANSYSLFNERGTCSDLMKNHWLRMTRQ